MSKDKGFTLIELLIVIAIIAILAAIVIPQFGKYRKQAAIAACQSDLRNAVTRCAAYLAENPGATSCPAMNATASMGQPTITINQDGSITASAPCLGAAVGTTCTIHGDSGAVNCS